jgi:hypothetical protein
MPKFMLILSSRPHVWKDLSPQELQQKAEKYQPWTDKIAARKVSSERLLDRGGQIVSMKNDKLTVVDGPYADTKEVIGGFMVMRAASMEEAIELTRTAPMLDDWTITIREVDPKGCGDT